MIVCKDIVELNESIRKDQFSNLSLTIDTTHGFPDIWIHHLFKDERVLIDCMRQYNRIWPIRTSINLHLADGVNAKNFVSMNFNNIHTPFVETKKAAQKQYILNNINFYKRVVRLFYKFDLEFAPPVCTFAPRYEIQFEMPLVFGQDPSTPIIIPGFEFIRFVSFLQVYSMQSLISAGWHHHMRPKHAGIEYLHYDCDMNFTLLTTSNQLVSIETSNLDAEIVQFSVNKFYPKFFEG